MSDRETISFTTPGGRAVLLRSYLTGREANELKAVMYSAVKMDMEDAQSGKVKVSDVPGTFLVEQERKALELLLVSIDGDTAAPIEKLLDLPSGEYDAVVKEINKIQNPTTPEKSGQPGWRRYFSSGVIEWNIQLVAILCKEMGWGYETYLSQPQEFVFMLMELRRAEIQHSNNAVQ